MARRDCGKQLDLSSMRSSSRTRSAVLLACLVMACGRARTESPPSSADSAFTALQERGAIAMGVNQYTSSHVFESLPDGGRIVLQRDSVDSAGTATIREHMRDIARRFSAGDFSIPGMVHAMEVPGTAAMTARRSSIRYSADTLPRGAQVRILTRDPTALAAVHEFLEFQRRDHRTKDHAH